MFVKPIKKEDSKKLKILEFRQNLKDKVESGEQSDIFADDLHGSQHERELLDSLMSMHGMHPSFLSNEDPV